MMIKYFGIFGLTVVEFLGCESAFEADDYHGERAEYCEKNTENCMLDPRDGSYYQIVKIGKQKWMAENLNLGEFVKTDSIRYQSGIQKFCYDNLLLNCNSDGGLYQWHTAMGLKKECSDGSVSCSAEIDSSNHQGICPDGWHLPSSNDWLVLKSQLSTEGTAGTKMKIARFNGDNSSGFSATLPGLYVFPNYFSWKDYEAHFWSINEFSIQEASVVYLTEPLEKMGESEWRKNNSLSIRCLKD